jgi:hypothetical protein
VRRKREEKGGPAQESGAAGPGFFVSVTSSCRKVSFDSMSFLVFWFIVSLVGVVGLNAEAPVDVFL